MCFDRFLEAVYVVASIWCLLLKQIFWYKKGILIEAHLAKY